MARQYGQDSEKGQIARAQKMKELEEETILKQKIERYASLGCVIIGVLFLVFGFLGAAKYNAKTTQTQAQLQEVQNKLHELEEAETDESTTVVEVESVASSAKDAGNAVCVAQNDLNAAAKAEAAAGMETLSEEHQDALNRLRMYFVKDGNNGMIRGTWCKEGVWEFNGVYQFEGSNMTVVWKCYAPDDEDKDRLLGFVKADYDSTRDVFTHGELRLTSWYETLATDDLITPSQDPVATGDAIAPSTNEVTDGVTSSQKSRDTGNESDSTNSSSTNTTTSTTTTDGEYQELDAYGNPIP